MDSSQYIKETSKEYSKYVCETRSIPKIMDGLKDGQRKALWLLRNKSEKIKTMGLAGEMLSSELYVHGDVSAADSISKLAAPYINNIPFIKGHGQFGSRILPIDGIGQPRYTSVQRSNITQKLIYPDIYIVPLEDNYDGSAKQPIYFLPLIPLVLLNGISGLAVGWSTDILRRNIKDIINNCINVLDKIPVYKMIPYYEKYDLDISHIIDNSWEFKGKIEIIDQNTLKVKELPFELSIYKFKDKLDILEEQGIINSYNDKSTKHIDINIKFPRGYLKDKSIEYLIDLLKIKQKMNERIVVIDFNNENIKQYNSAEEVLIEYVNWRLQWYVTRYEYFKKEDEYQLKYLQSIKLCFDNDIQSKLKNIKSKNQLINDVKNMTNNNDETQLNKIINIPIYKWTIESYNVILKEIKKMEDNITEYESILNSNTKRKNIYKKELKELFELF